MISFEEKILLPIGPISPFYEFNISLKIFKIKVLIYGNKILTGSPRGPVLYFIK